MNSMCERLFISVMLLFFSFFFSSRRRHTRSLCDWSSDVCSFRSPFAYPISSFTYILVYKDQPDPAKGQALLQFLWWAVHDGEKAASARSEERRVGKECRSRWSP